MTEEVENLVLEHLKRIQAELSGIRERDRELFSRLGSIESLLARSGRDAAQLYEEIITDRHAADAMRERLSRIERRLELGDA